MKKLLLLPILLLFALPSFAQGVRMGDSSPITSSLTTPGQISTVSNAIIRICTYPANAVPCSNLATTYTSVTLGTPCATSTQIVLAGTSSCTGTTDARGNWGAWIAPGNYDFTVQVSTGQAFGPFTISAGNSVSGTATNLLGPGAIAGTFSGTSTLTGALQITNPCTIDGQIFVTTGGCYTTVQAAMTAANAAGGGTVLIPDGSFVGPTTWYSGVAVKAMHYTRRDICNESLLPAGCLTTAQTSLGTTLTYTSSLTWTDLNGMEVNGITLDFGGLGNLTMAGVSRGLFDMTVNNCLISAPCLVMINSAGNNTAGNKFNFLGTFGGNGGLQMKGTAAKGAFVNKFDLVLIGAAVQPSGAFTALDFNSLCDTNQFTEVGFYGGPGITNANGVIFNSATPTVDSGANGITVDMFWTTTLGFAAGTGVTFNQSVGNFIRTGVLNYVSASPCLGSSTYCAQTGGSPNTISYTWIQNAPNQAASIFATGINLNCQGVNCTSTITALVNGVQRWQTIMGSGYQLFDVLNGKIPFTINSNAPSNSLVIPTLGGIAPLTVTFATLPASGNGVMVFCSDCNATCSAGAGTGRTCFRENGAWTH